MDDNEMICWCSGVTRGRITEAIKNSAKTLDDIRRMTGACTLGKCREMSPKKRCCAPDIIAILKEYGQA